MLELRPTCEHEGPASAGGPRRLFKGCAALAALALALAGCTTKAWYDAVQASAAAECNKKAPTDRDTCRAQLNTKSYEQYEEGRTKSKP